MRRPTCGDCPCWAMYPEEPTQGKCQRYAPGNTMCVDATPELHDVRCLKYTQESDWCSENFYFDDWQHYRDRVTNLRAIHPQHPKRSLHVVPDESAWVIRHSYTQMYVTHFEDSKDGGMPRIGVHDLEAEAMVFGTELEALLAMEDWSPVLRWSVQRKGENPWQA